MFTLPLEPIDNRARPAFNDPAGCKKWLDQLQFTNLPKAQATLRAQLDEFNRSPARSLDRLQTLEALREPVRYVQGEFTKRLAGKPLPLDANELAILTAATGLWQSVLTGYRRCLEAYQSGDAQLAPHAALLCHRCLLYGGLQIFEHLRAGYAFDDILWQQLHGLYAFAEERKLLAVEIQDELSEFERRTTCQKVYLRTLLLCYARPQALTRGQQQLLDRWLSDWIATINVERTCAISQGDAPPLSIDLAAARGLRAVRPGDQTESDSVRFLAMVPLSKLLRVKTILLQQGQTPKHLERDGSASGADCVELLTYVHKQLCEPRPPQVSERSGATREMMVCYGLEDIHAFIANQPFVPGKKPAQEAWRAEEISLLGARLVRKDAKGVRLNANRAAVVRIPENTTFRVGYIVWIRVARNDQLQMSLRFLPGAPRAISVKDAVAAAGVANPRQAGILLPAMPELGIPASLLIPRNLFQPGRLLEATLAPGSDNTIRVKLGFSIEKGTDYERVSFTPA